MKRLTGHPAINATMPRDFHILIIICLCSFYDCPANVKCLAGNSAINVKILNRDFYALISLCFMISLLSLL